MGRYQIERQFFIRIVLFDILRHRIDNIPIPVACRLFPQFQSFSYDPVNIADGIFLISCNFLHSFQRLNVFPPHLHSFQKIDDTKVNVHHDILPEQGGFHRVASEILKKLLHKINRFFFISLL